MHVRDVVANSRSIDAYLGPNQYNDWVQETKNAKAELARYERVRARIPPHYLAYIAGEASMDADIVESTTNDYNWGIEQIQQGKRVSPGQLERIGGIQSTALEALRIETDVLEAISIAGVFAGFLSIQYRNIELAAQRALIPVKALEEALRKARKTSIEARFQQVADIGLTLLTIFVPELGILAKVGIAATQFGLDRLLGGSKSTARKDTLSDVASVSAVDLAAMEDWTWLSASSRGAAKTAGKGVAVIGLYFDQDEVQAALKKEAVVREALAKAVENLRAVKALLERIRPDMLRLKVQLTQLAKEVKISKKSSAEIRDEYRRMIQEANYPARGPVQWRYN